MRTKKSLRRDIKHMDKELKKKILEREENRRRNHSLFLKAVLSHRDDFFRYHRFKRSDALKAGKYYIYNI